MAPPQKAKPVPGLVIDLHGIREALTTTSNARARVIDAIEDGRMLVIRSVSDELKSAFEDLYPDFAAINGKRYVTPEGADFAAASQMQTRHGASLFGSIPSYAAFEAVAIAHRRKCQLVSGGKALVHCRAIAAKAGLPSEAVIGITSL